MPDRSSTTVPLRGTQSLVGVMGFVWRHPSLTAGEVLWRWLAAAPLLWLGWRALAPHWAAVHVDRAALEAITLLEPARAAATMSRTVRAFLPPAQQVARWWIPLAAVVWASCAAVGRRWTLARAQPELHGRGAASLFALSLARALAFLALLGLWAEGCALAVRWTVTGPDRAGQEPNVVLLTALVVALTLASFLLWSATIWALDLSVVRGLLGRPALRSEQRRELRSKLVETNLVMGIVRVSLLVLAMTFSASPLPFQTEQTQAFIDVWWVGVGLLYVLASDFFHVVRRITYLRLLETVAGTGSTNPRAAS